MSYYRKKCKSGTLENSLQTIVDKVGYPWEAFFSHEETTFPTVPLPRMPPSPHSTNGPTTPQHMAPAAAQQGRSSTPHKIMRAAARTDRATLQPTDSFGLGLARLPGASQQDRSSTPHKILRDVAQQDRATLQPMDSFGLGLARLPGTAQQDLAGLPEVPPGFRRDPEDHTHIVPKRFEDRKDRKRKEGKDAGDESGKKKAAKKKKKTDRQQKDNRKCEWKLCR